MKNKDIFNSKRNVNNEKLYKTTGDISIKKNNESNEEISGET